MPRRIREVTRSASHPADPAFLGVAPGGEVEHEALRAARDRLHKRRDVLLAQLADVPGDVDVLERDRRVAGSRRIVVVDMRVVLCACLGGAPSLSAGANGTSLTAGA